MGKADLAIMLFRRFGRQEVGKISFKHSDSFCWIFFLSSGWGGCMIQCHKVLFTPNSSLQRKQSHSFSLTPPWFCQDNFHRVLVSVHLKLSAAQLYGPHHAAAETKESTRTLSCMCFCHEPHDGIGLIRIIYVKFKRQMTKGLGLFSSG